MARPRKQIDSEQVKKLAAIDCSLEEIGSIVGCSVDTLGRRFADVIKEGREHGRMSLKRKQFEVAMGGNVSMLIWLGKIRLGQREVQILKQETTHIVDEGSMHNLIDQAKELAEKI